MINSHRKYLFLFCAGLLVHLCNMDTVRTMDSIFIFKGFF